MIQAIAPLLADEGLDIEMQTPARWLLHPRTGTAGWQLSCTPIEAVGESHIDVLMPQGPDAKRFLRLLNEVQMSWNLLTLNEPQDLPVNAIWPSGPAHSPAIDAMRGQDDAALTLQVSRTRDNVLFAVADQGPGIPEEQQEKVFEAFFTTKPEGMGMGLNICRSIIESHAGRLWVESNQPRGCIFKFTLPVHEGPAHDDTAPA